MIMRIQKIACFLLVAFSLTAAASGGADAQTVDEKESPATQAALTAAHPWRLVSLGDQEVPEAAGVTLTFDEKNQFSGSGGVNSFGGEYEANAGGRITFGLMSATEKGALDPKLSKRESDYFRLLAKAKRALISDEKLVLECQDKDEKQVRLVFVAVQKK
jgi:heat shock protein HslJ